MMYRRTALGAVAVVLCPSPLLAQTLAQTSVAGRVYRLGLLEAGRLPLQPPDAYDITTLLGERGYVEGRNLIIERRYAQGQFERLPELARELASLRLDAIYAIGSSAAHAAKQATATTPIVILQNADPVASGMVQSLARPGVNITGVLITPQGTLAGKRLESLLAWVPNAKRVALLIPEDPGPGTLQQLAETRAAAASVGLDLNVILVRGDDYASAFAALASQRTQALIVAAHFIFVRDRQTVIELAAKHRLPAIYEWPRQVREGGLMSYGANDLETFRKVASYIDRVLKGENPADMPFWQPQTLHLVINLRTARALGLTPTEILLLRADEVIN